MIVLKFIHAVHMAVYYTLKHVVLQGFSAAYPLKIGVHAPEIKLKALNIDF